MNEESPQSSELEARIVALLLGEASDFEREELNRLLGEREDLRQFKNQIQRVHKLMHHAAGDEPLVDATEFDASAENDWKLDTEKRTAVLAALGGETTASTSEASVLPSLSQALNPQIITRPISVSLRRFADSIWPKSIESRITKPKYVVAACLAVIVLVIISASLPRDPRQVATTEDESSMMSDSIGYFLPNDKAETEIYSDEFQDMEDMGTEIQATRILGGPAHPAVPLPILNKEEEESPLAETSRMWMSPSTTLGRESDSKSSFAGNSSRSDANAPPGFRAESGRPQAAGNVADSALRNSGIEMDMDMNMGGGMGKANNMKNKVMGGNDDVEAMEKIVTEDMFEGREQDEEAEAEQRQGRITAGSEDNDGIINESLRRSASLEDTLRFSRSPSAIPSAAKPTLTVPSYQGQSSGSKPSSGLVDETIAFPTVTDESVVDSYARARGRSLQAEERTAVAGMGIADSRVDGKNMDTPPVSRSINAPQQPAAGELFADGGGGGFGDDGLGVGGMGGAVAGRKIPGGGFGGGVAGGGNHSGVPGKLAETNAAKQEAKASQQESGQQQAQAGQRQAQGVQSNSWSGRGSTANTNGQANATARGQSPNSSTATPRTLAFPASDPQADFFASGDYESAEAETSSARSMGTIKTGKDSLAIVISGKLGSERLRESIVDKIETTDRLNRAEPSVAGPGPGVISNRGSKENYGLPRDTTDIRVSGTPIKGRPVADQVSEMLGILEKEGAKKAKSDHAIESQQDRSKNAISDQPDPFSGESSLRADLAANGIVDLSKSLNRKPRQSKRDLNGIENQMSWDEKTDREFGEKRQASQFGIWSKKTAKKKSEVPIGLTELDAQTNAFSTFSLHVSDVSFKLAYAALSQGEWPRTDQIRVEEFVNAFDYGDPMPTQEEKVACQIEQSVHPFLQQRNLMRVSMRTAAAGRSSQTPLRLTFLLDNSGSMERIDRQQTVRRAFAVLAQQLTPIDQVTLISFARQPRLLADRVSGAEAANLLKMIDELPSEGGTNLEAALQIAFQKAREQQLDNAQNRIILLTDGAVNLGDASPERLSNMIVNMRNSGIAFDAAGISADGLNDEILEALTRKGDGRYYLLDSLESVDEGFAKQIAGALRPAAKNVKIQIEFNPDRVGKYKLLGFEKHRLKKEDFRNDKIDAAEMTAAEAGVAVYQFEAKPDGHGDIGTVSIRFRDVATGEMVEELWPILYEAMARSHDLASPSMKIATAASLVATKLKGEALSDTVDLRVLANLVAGLPPQYGNNQRVEMLRAMIQQARQLSGN